MRQNSANRRPLTLDGGVDGRVFEVSADGRRLLFTRTLGDAAENGALVTATPAALEQEKSAFNSLWVIFDTSDPQSEAVRLDLNNILYADWVPGSERTIVYSTAEPRASFPGWQANNDLWTAQVSANGGILRPRQLLESSSGGIYGWYGTFFDFSPDGLSLAWAQPDSVGILLPVTSDEANNDFTPTPESTDEGDASVGLPPSFKRESLFHFAPRNAYDFVWVPSLAWSPDGSLLLTVTHGASLGTESPEDSPVFNVTVLPAEGGYSVDLVPQAGMWGLAQYSPPQEEESDDDVVIAYLKADDPFDSVVSRYRLAVMDRDGSNSRIIFPSQDQPGIAPKDFDYRGFVWSPDARQIALVYQGNLYLIDVVTGLDQQLTRDGLATNPRWTP
jgi:hypothetical protein